MKLLVTGGSGYLGAAILKRAPIDWQIAATYNTHFIAQQNVAAFRVDAREAEIVNRVVTEFRPDLVIHTAALMTGDAMLAVNADGSRNIARAAKQNSARLIHLSSDVIFDGEHAPYDESAEPQPLIPYAESKAQAERAVREEHADALIVRTSLIYGFEPMDPRTCQVLNGEMPHLFTDEYRCPIFVDDLADALLELASQKPGFFEKPGFSTLNIAGMQRLSRYDFGVKLANVFHVEPKFAPALSASHPTRRPRDCALDIARAQKILRTRLRSLDQVLATIQLSNE